MKKKLCLLALLPLTVLSSCGGASEISDPAEIEEAINHIAENAPEIWNYELLIEAEETSFDDAKQKNVTVKSKSTFEQKSNGSGHYHFVGDREGENIEVDMLSFRGTRESALGMSYYWRILKPEKELSEDETTEIYKVASTVNAYAPEYAWEFMYIKNFEKHTISRSESVKYFSEGEGNLTIKVDRVIWTDNNDSSKKDVARYTVHYDENTFKWVYLEEISHTNTKSTYNIRMNPKDEITIELPSDWQSLGYKKFEVNY